MSFNTGDNLPLERGVLKRSSRYLQGQGYEHKGVLGDLRGTYAYHMRFQGRSLYLVARRAKPYIREGVQYISTQKVLINRAAEEQRPILVSMWYKHQSTPFFQVFDPVQIKRLYAKELLDMDHDNTRFGVKMLNYEWNLGLDVDPVKIWGMIDKVKKYVKNKTEEEQTKLAPIKLRVTVEQKIIACEGCDCRYSDKMGTCPVCGRPTP